MWIIGKPWERSYVTKVAYDIHITTDSEVFLWYSCSGCRYQREMKDFRVRALNIYMMSTQGWHDSYFAHICFFPPGSLTDQIRDWYLYYESLYVVDFPLGSVLSHYYSVSCMVRNNGLENLEVGFCWMLPSRFGGDACLIKALTECSFQEVLFSPPDCVHVISTSVSRNKPWYIVHTQWKKVSILSSAFRSQKHATCSELHLRVKLGRYGAWRNS